MFVQAPPASITTPAPHVIVEPDWLQRPTGDDMADAYPEGALRAAVPGFALLTCHVSTQGAAVGCEVLQESPAGAGFGDAALAVSRRFRFKPQTLDGHATDAGEVTIPLSFKIPSGAAPPGVSSALLWRETTPGQPLPAARTGPCPGDPTKLCTNESLAWSVAPNPAAFVGLYGVTAFVCRIGATGELTACRDASLTPGAHVRAAQHYVSRYRAPLDVGGKPTAGSLATFFIVPPGPPA